MLRLLNGVIQYKTMIQNSAQQDATQGQHRIESIEERKNQSATVRN